MSERPSTMQTADRTVRSLSENLPSNEPSNCFLQVPSPRIFWRGKDGNRSMLGWGSALELTATGPERFQSIRRLASRVNVRDESDSDGVVPGPRWFGGFSFRAREQNGSGWEAFGQARFRLPRFVVINDGRSSWLLLNVLDSEQSGVWKRRRDSFLERLEGLTTPSPRPASSTRVGLRDHRPARSAWLTSSNRVLGELDGGSLDKLVLARQTRLRVKAGSDVLLPSVVRPVSRTSQYVFERSADQRFFCHSPESLVSLKGSKFRTECLAGTAARSSTRSRDQLQRSVLQQSTKDRIEHDLVVDYVREQLEPRVDRLKTGSRRTRPLEDLHHLCTPIRGRVAPGTHVLDLVKALHPTPAVGGLPADRALDVQQQLEPFVRGWYASPMGWFNDRGEGEFTVGIRAARQTGDELSLYAGAGLVRGSDPAREWEEVELKYHSLLSSFGLRVT